MAARKPLITRLQYVMRFEVEMVRHQLRYCQHLGLWRHCPDARCRRHRICSSDGPKCMLWAHNNLTEDELCLAHRDILAALPKNIGAPECAAQNLGPRSLITTTSAGDAFVEYLRDHKGRWRTQQSAVSAKAKKGKAKLIKGLQAVIAAYGKLKVAFGEKAGSPQAAKENA